jgi:flagellar biosynthesis protein FliR
MLIPGFAVARVPVVFRVLLAFALSAAVYPLMSTYVTQNGIAGGLPLLILSELAVGLTFGFLCAIFAHAVRFFAGFSMAMIGLSGIPGQPIEDLEANSAFVTLLSMSFTAFVFATELHLVGFKAIVDTYHTYPVGFILRPLTVMNSVEDTLRDTSLMALQASSPFILHSLAVSFALGLIGKLTPQLQAYFALMGMSIMVAILTFYLVSPSALTFMVGTYANWLENGT